MLQIWLLLLTLALKAVAQPGVHLSPKAVGREMKAFVDDSLLQFDLSQVAGWLQVDPQNSNASFTGTRMYSNLGISKIIYYFFFHDHDPILMV